MTGTREEARDSQSCADLQGEVNQLLSPYTDEEPPACTSNEECVFVQRGPSCGGPLCGILLHTSQVDGYMAAVDEAAPLCEERGQLACFGDRVASCANRPFAQCVEGRCDTTDQRPAKP